MSGPSLIGVVTDTDVLKNQENLRQDAALFRLIFEQASVGMALVDLLGRPARTNSALDQMLGYGKEALQQTTFMELTYPEDRVRDVELLAQLVTGDLEQYQVEKRLIREDGTPVWCRFSGSLVRDGEGRPLHVLYLIEDISERIRSQRSISKLAAFAEFNPNPVFEFTPDGSLRYSNKAALELAQAVEKSDAAGILPLETRKVVAECWATGKNRLRLTTQLKGRTISWSFFPIPAVGRVHCYAGDITEKLALEMRLLQSQKLEAIGQLAAGVAHDFNNLLTVIEGNASMFLSEAALPSAALEHIQQVMHAAQRAASLTRQLLLFSRKQVFLPTYLDIHEVVWNMTRMLQRLLGENIVLVSDFAPNPPKIYADPGMVEQVLLNLAVNARDAMPRGGQLSIRTCSKFLDENQLRQAVGVQPGQFVCLSVSDTGIGIAPEHMSRIFEPFFTTKDVGKGTGLGLATVYGIVQQHHGWIDLESELGKGTTFSIYLPAVHAPEPQVKEPPVSSSVPQGSETILVVEDEAALRLLVGSLLRRYGYTVLMAESGDMAMDIWKRHRNDINLLFTDLIMPGAMNGRELADFCAQEKPGLKVLFTSGYSPDVASGGNLSSREGLMFLQKPYHPQKLAQLIRDCLDGRESI